MRPGAGRLGCRRAGRLRTPALGTGRLRLDPLRVADAAAMVAVLADPVLYTFTGGDPPALEDLQSRYAAQVAGHSPDGAEQWHNWIVRRADAGDEVGFVQATVSDAGAAADIAWVIGARWQGRGYATEAALAMVAWLRETGVVVVTAHVHPDHEASARVAARAGLAATAEVEDGERVWRLRAERGPGSGGG